MCSKVTEDMSSPFFGVCEGRVAVEDVKKADIVVWTWGAGRRREREGSGMVLVENVGGVDGEIGGHFCVG